MFNTFEVRYWLLTVAILLAAGIATAQVEDQLEYNFLGAGARANGMGDAFVAVADDATAIFWNPAGLFLLDQPETSFGFQFASEKVEQERPRQMLLIASNDPGGSVGLSFASFVFPKRFGQKKFVFAFAIQKAFDFKAESLEIAAQAPFVLEQERSSGGPFSYSGGVAFSPLQGLMLGLSLSLYRGDADIAGNQIVTLGDGIVRSLSGSSRIPVDGISVGMGALYDFQARGGPPMRLGFKFAAGELQPAYEAFLQADALLRDDPEVQSQISATRRAIDERWRLDLIEQGRQALNDEQPDEAQRLAQEVLRRFPADSDADLLLLSVARYQAEEIEQRLRLEAEQERNLIREREHRLKILSQVQAALANGRDDAVGQESSLLVARIAFKNLGIEPPRLGKARLKSRNAKISGRRWSSETVRRYLKSKSGWKRYELCLKSNKLTTALRQRQT